MPTDGQLPRIIKETRCLLGLSQERLARELGVSFATVNRWENGLSKPSQLARARFEAFCRQMVDEGRLDLRAVDWLDKTGEKPQS